MTKHWTENSEVWPRFWSFARELYGGLVEDAQATVHEVLEVDSVKHYKGTMAEAKAALEAHAATLRNRDPIDELAEQVARDYQALVAILTAEEPPPPEHREARVTMFLDVFAPDGTRVALTAREGATADMVALTALGLWDGARILAGLGWTTAAENGKPAVATLAQVQEVVEGWQGTPHPPASTAPPASQAQAASGNGGGELLTELVKITMPKDKPVIEFWQPNRKWAEIKWYLGGEAFLKQVAPTLGKAGWTAWHFDTVGREYTVSLKVVWAVSPKDAKYKDITAVTLR